MHATKSGAPPWWRSKLTGHRRQLARRWPHAARIARPAGCRSGPTTGPTYYGVRHAAGEPKPDRGQDRSAHGWADRRLQLAGHWWICPASRQRSAPNLFSLVRRRSSMWWRVLQDSNPGGFHDGLAAGCDPPAIPRRAPPSRSWTTPYRPCGCMIYGARYANRLPARWRHGIGRQRVQRHIATQVRRRSQRRAPKAPETLAPAARRTSDGLIREYSRAA